MMTVLIYVFATYLAVCWLWGLYLAIRLYTGRRLRQVMAGEGMRTRLVRPLNSGQAPASARVSRPSAAETLAESRAA